MPLRFAPRWYFTALTLAAVVLFVSLGSWQWHRGVSRRAVWQAFEQGTGEPVEATAASLGRLPRFARVRVTGQWDRDRQFLLDNISHAGRPGYEVLTALVLVDGSRLLVNRGWLPFGGYRDRLPDLAIADGGAQTLTGQLSTLPAPGLAFGRQPPASDGPWPRLTTFPTRAELEGALGETLHEPVLLLDAGSGAGYLREWSPPGVAPDRHFSYAIQWWLFASVAFGLYVSLNLKRVK